MLCIRDAEEGTIDPLLKTISFWNGDEPVAVLTYYATHPQSYYGKGDVTAEFIGLARAEPGSTAEDLLRQFSGAADQLALGRSIRSPHMRSTCASASTP